MATLTKTPRGLNVVLSGKEEFFGLKKSFEIPWEQVLNIASVSDLWEHRRGIRAPGTGFPGVIMLGTTRYQGHKDFNAIYGHKPGVVITLNGNEFSRVLLTRSEQEPVPQRPTS